MPAPLRALAATAGAAEWSPETALMVKRVQTVRASPDGTRAAYVVGAAVTKDEKSEWLYQVHVARADGSGAFALTGGEKSSNNPVWSPDGKLVDQSNDSPTWRQRSRVAIVPVEGGTRRLLAETPDGQPNLLGWTRDGRIAFGETDRTVNRIGLLPPDGAAPVFVSPAGQMADNPSLNETGTHVAFSSQAPDRAPEPFVASIARFVPVQVATVQDLPALAYGRTETLTWRSPDGREVEGLVTYPPE